MFDEGNVVLFCMVKVSDGEFKKYYHMRQTLKNAFPDQCVITFYSVDARHLLLIMLAVCFKKNNIHGIHKIFHMVKN